MCIRDSHYPVASSTLSPEVALRLAETLGPAGAPEQMVTVRCENLTPLVHLALTTDVYKRQIRGFGN